MPQTDFCAALRERGYTPLIAIGFGERADGTYSVKVAAHPALRSLHAATWTVTLATIMQALARIHSDPLDDMEIG